MKKIDDMSREELAAYVCSHLDKSGIEVTLTGGSCVSIYSDNRYVSLDLDFIEKMAYKKVVCRRPVFQPLHRLLSEQYCEHTEIFHNNAVAEFLLY